MSALLERIKSEQLQARKDKDVERNKLLTMLIGEVQRSPTKVETDEEVIDLINAYIKKIRKLIKDNPYDGQESVLAELEQVENEFLPNNKLSEDEIKALIDGLENKNVRVVMPFLSKYEKEHDVIIDKAFAKQYIS